MKFLYIGEAPNGFIEQYGAIFRPGVPADVTEPDHVRRLLGNRFFQAVEDETPPQDPAAGGSDPPRRKPKHKPTQGLA